MGFGYGHNRNPVFPLFVGMMSGQTRTMRFVSVVTNCVPQTSDSVAVGSIAWR